ncbi:MAG: Ig-like domain-containing protein [Gaiellaceae bacterium]
MRTRRPIGPLSIAFLIGGAVLAAFVPGAGRAGPILSLTYTATADSYVSAVSPKKVHGSLGYMRVDGAPRRGYVRFNVSGVTGTVAKAWLRLYSLKSHPTGFEVRGVADNSWQESTLSYLNAPPASDSVTALSGPFATNSWLSLDVTPLVRGDGTYSFALTSASMSYFTLATRERGLARAPQLVVEEIGTIDVTPPSAPTNLGATGSTATSISAVWGASTDDVAVAGYGVYVDGAPVGSATQPSFTFGEFACGRIYTIGVDAYDVAGNRSSRTSLTVATTACPDTQPPTAPTNLVQSDATQSTVSLTWTPSSDNIGVFAYSTYLNGTQVASTTGTNYTFASLTCGTGYMLAVEAYDLAGNISARSSLPGATSACPGDPGTTYYVDDATGNDANAGTSEAAPWKTLAKAGSAPLLPGDALLLRRGGSWTGSLTVSRSGTAAAPIAVGAYGAGAQPIVSGAGSCVVLSGSWIVLRDVHADNCSWAGVELLGSNDRVENSLITRNVAGVDIKSSALDSKILGNEIRDNNKMSVLTSSPTNDDSGAFGVLVAGDRTEIAYNTISGSDAFSYDYGRDGAAVEIYGGRESTIHHNLAIENQDFTELGHSRSADNTYSYNVVRSSLGTSKFLITRGSSSSFGPVLRTHAYNNTVFLTGSASQGFVCSSGCTRDILRLRDNVIQAVWKVGYADGPVDEDHDLFSGGIVQFTKGASSIIANPRFVGSTGEDLHLQGSSPAVDNGANLGLERDFDMLPVPVDGNGDGVVDTDIGAYEYRVTAGTDTTPPAAPSNLIATGSTASSVTLSWSAATDNVAVVGYGLYRDGTAIGSSGATNYTFTGLSCGTSYTLAVDAYDAAGNRSAKASVTLPTSSCADVNPPSPPTNVTVTATSLTSVALAWSASIDDSGVAGYGLYRDGALVGSATQLGYTFTGLSCGTSYSFAVDAYDSAGNRSAKTYWPAATLACADTESPSVSVTSPAAGATVSGTVTLSANASDNIAVTQVKWFVDGAEVGWDGNGAPWTSSWNSSAFSDGSHVIFARASDAAGNWGTSASVGFNVGNDPPPPPPPSGGDPVIAAAGDIACVPGYGASATTCRQQFTADVITQMNPTAVLNLGDAQYETGTLANFQNSYDRSWGAFKSKTWATAGGSHDYYGGGDWYTYFGTRAGPAPYKPFSFDLGAWHIISLNSQCSDPNVGGCSAGTSQLDWLRDDLAAHPASCTLAFWHNARWSSGPRHGTDARTDALVRLLHGSGAELILSSHDHDYERFAPQTPDGLRDDARGIAQFVVGTGGKSLETSFGTIQANSLARQTDTFGVLKLTLHASSYDWQFVPEAGKSYSDSGTTNCH